MLNNTYRYRTLGRRTNRRDKQEERDIKLPEFSLQVQFVLQGVHRHTRVEAPRR